MASAVEHAQTVLSAIIPDRRDLLERAVTFLTPEHFPEPPQANLFRFLVHYSDRTGGAIIPLKYLSDNLREKLDAGKALQYEELYEACAETHVPDDQFLWSMDQLRDRAAEQATGEALTEAMEILRQGKEERGEFIQGHAEARQRLLESFQEIDREITRQDAPEGNMKDEFSDLLDDYAQAKARRLAGTSGGIRTGVEEIDRKVGGFQRGELILLAGYSSDGKSSFGVQVAWSAAVEQGKNVVFLTTETLRHQIRRKIVSRHSKLPQFGLLPDGLNSWDLKSGTLPDELEAKYTEVTRDLTKNPAYGNLFIAQVPRSATLASLDQRLHRIQRGFDIDLVVMDYLALLQSGLRRQSNREELEMLMKEAKLLAVNFNNGQGVPFVSPWQVSRDARTKAEQAGMYDSTATSGTAEATNSADLILSLLAPTDNTSRYTDITMQILKNRDGETANGITVEVDYATSTFRSRTVPGLDLRRSADGRASLGSDDYGSLLDTM